MKLDRTSVALCDIDECDFFPVISNRQSVDVQCVCFFAPLWQEIEFIVNVENQQMKFD